MSKFLIYVQNMCKLLLMFAFGFLTYFQCWAQGSQDEATIIGLGIKQPLAQIIHDEFWHQGVQGLQKEKTLGLLQLSGQKQNGQVDFYLKLHEEMFHGDLWEDSIDN